MREILFRGKRTDNGEWVEGGYFKWVNLAGEEQPLILVRTESGFSYNQVLPETVCQFTGLTDKNGVKIFEGDIVSTDIERPYLIVEFRDGCFMFNCNDGGEDYYDIMVPALKEPQTVKKASSECTHS